jgi:hypothetical protein
MTDAMQNGENGQGAAVAAAAAAAAAGSAGKIDPHALQAAFSSKGFHVPKRTLSKLANQKPDGSSERKLRVSKSVSAAKK